MQIPEKQSNFLYVPLEQFRLHIHISWWCVVTKTLYKQRLKDSVLSGRVLGKSWPPPGPGLPLHWVTRQYLAVQ